MRSCDMPRFFFHTHDHEDHHDNDGRELPSIEAARETALSYLIEQLKDHPQEFLADAHWEVQVENDQGLTLMTLYISEVDAPAMPEGSRIRA